MQQKPCHGASRRPVPHLAAVVLALFACACGSSIYDRMPDVGYRFLAQDFHAQIAGQPVTLPLIAVRDYVADGRFRTVDWYASNRDTIEARDDFVAKALDPETAPGLDLIEVNIGNYGLSDTAKQAEAKQRDLCPNLTRVWSRIVCTDSSTALQAALPVNRQFELVDLRRMSVLNGAPGARCAAKPAPVPTDRGKVVIYCPTAMHGSDEHFTAIIRIRGDLGATWSVSQGENTVETANEMATREGRAVMLFVKNGLGPKEDYAPILAGMPVLRRPPPRERQ